MGDSAVKIDLSAYSIPQLNALIALAENQIAVKQRDRIETVRLKLRQTANSLDEEIARELARYDRKPRPSRKKQS